MYDYGEENQPSITILVYENEKIWATPIMNPLSWLMICTIPSRHTVVCRNLFPLYGNFNTFMKRRKKKKHEETKPVFGSSYLGNAWRHLFEIWNLGY